MHTLEITTIQGCANLEFLSPILTLATLRELTMHLTTLATGCENKPLVLTSSHPGIFLAGADLSEIGQLDPHSSVRYAEFGRRAVGALRTYPSPTIAAVDGSCSGGGFDLVLACDVVISSASATFSHPGVMRGLVTGWGGTVDVPRRLSRPLARGALLEGRRMTASHLVEAGVVHAITGNPVDAAYERALRLMEVHPARRQLWRLLRRGICSTGLQAFLTQGIID